MSISRLSKQDLDHIKGSYSVANIVDIIRSLVENAIDANATKVTISLTGEKSPTIEVEDNGDGLQSVESCALLATEFCSSRSGMPRVTYGHEGLALHNILHVSYSLQIETGDRKIFLREGVPPEVTASRPINGFRVTVDQPFYEQPIRQSTSFGYSSTTSKDIWPLLQQYAVASPSVTFVFIKRISTFAEPKVWSTKKEFDLRLSDILGPDGFVTWKGTGRYTITSPNVKEINTKVEAYHSAAKPRKSKKYTVLINGKLAELKKFAGRVNSRITVANSPRFDASVLSITFDPIPSCWNRGRTPFEELDDDIGIADHIGACMQMVSTLPENCPRVATLETISARAPSDVRPDRVDNRPERLYPRNGTSHGRYITYDRIDGRMRSPPRRISQPTTNPHDVHENDSASQRVNVVRKRPRMDPSLELAGDSHTDKMPEGPHSDRFAEQTGNLHAERMPGGPRGDSMGTSMQLDSVPRSRNSGRPRKRASTRGKGKKRVGSATSTRHVLPKGQTTMSPQWGIACHPPSLRSNNDPPLDQPVDLSTCGTDKILPLTVTTSKLFVQTCDKLYVILRISESSAADVCQCDPWPIDVTCLQDSADDLNEDCDQQTMLDALQKLHDQYKGWRCCHGQSFYRPIELSDVQCID